mgnify:CR=1 FL=1
MSGEGTSNCRSGCSLQDTSYAIYYLIIAFAIMQAKCMIDDAIKYKKHWKLFRS